MHSWGFKIEIHIGHVLHKRVYVMVCFDSLIHGRDMCMMITLPARNRRGLLLKSPRLAARRHCNLLSLCCCLPFRTEEAHLVTPTLCLWRYMAAETIILNVHKVIHKLGRHLVKVSHWAQMALNTWIYSFLQLFHRFAGQLTSILGLHG